MREFALDHVLMHSFYPEMNEKPIEMFNKPPGTSSNNTDLAIVMITFRYVTLVNKIIT